MFVVRYDESEHSVRCVLNIENWSTWLMTDPSVRTHCGHISDLFPPPVVFPATREVMEGYKTVSSGGNVDLGQSGGGALFVLPLFVKKNDIKV